MKRALIFCLLPLAFSTQPLIAETHAGYPIQTTPATGGEGTVNQADTNAYSLPQGNLSMTKRLDFSVGNSFFRNPWVEAPASTDAPGRAGAPVQHQFLPGLPHQGWPRTPARR